MKNPRYKRLEIEWKHFAVGDATCERCGNTGDALRTVIEELRREFAPAGVKINLTETLLDKTRLAESNEIRMNGMLLEDLLAAGVVSTDCPSCGTLAGESACCRAIEIGDEQYENIPPELIKKAAYLALGITKTEITKG
jgi:hypothetical protein